MSATSYGRQKLGDHLTGVAVHIFPPLYLSAHLGDPGLAGSHAFEVSGAGYARQPLDGVMSAFDSDGWSVNTSIISFGPAVSNWGTIVFFGIEEAAVGGNMVWPGVPTMPRTITIGQPLQIPIGQLRLRIN
jgi:hypothetical protein